jgi:hypothetical protein
MDFLALSSRHFLGRESMFLPKNERFPVNAKSFWLINFSVVFDSQT